MINSSPCSLHLVQFFILALNNNKVITNPYLRGKLVEVLSQFTPERFGTNYSRFFQLIQSDPMAIRYLGPGLFQFYIGTKKFSSLLPPPFPFPLSLSGRAYSRNGAA